MATLGAELGCERYLALTVVTGSGQRSSTFLAKLRRNSVFVLALRAFHCRPRRKKRARCTARVTSQMIGDKADALHEICSPNTQSVGRAHRPAFPSARGRSPAEAIWGVCQSADAARDSVYGSASFRLDAREFDHLAPFLRFVGDELAKVGGREREHVATQVGKPRLHLGIGEGRIDLLVELL